MPFFKPPSILAEITDEQIRELGYIMPGDCPSVPPQPCPPPTDAEIRALGYIMPSDCPEGPIDPPIDPPVGELVWADPFISKPRPSLQTNRPADWIPHPGRLNGGTPSGIITYEGVDEIRFWNNQERDDTIAHHHTMIGMVYAEEFKPQGDRIHAAVGLEGHFKTKFKIMFESAPHGGAPDPNWNIFYQEKASAYVNPSLAFTLKDGKLHLVRRGDASDSVSDSKYDQLEKYQLGPAKFDHWYNFEYEIFHSYKISGPDAGFLKVWMDGNLMINDSNIMTTFRANSHGGIFRSCGHYQYMGPDGNEENACRMRNIEIRKLS